MKLNSPLPQSLPKECAKAANIFKSFVDGGNNGLDRVIPRSVLENAKGFCILSIFKAGFLFSARAGSGIVIAKLDDQSWSAPSAIGTAGFGLGGQAGAEMTDFLVVLNSVSAVKSFMSAGSVTLGGSMSVAIGPLGRNGEALGSVNMSGKVTAMYSYSRSRGLFGGVSIEGSVIIERQDANAMAYNSDVTAKMLLSGDVKPPEWASTLIKTLDACTGIPGGRQWVEEGGGNAAYLFGSVESPKIEKPSMFSQKRKKKKPPFPPPSWGTPTDTGSFFDAHEEPTLPPLFAAQTVQKPDTSATTNFDTYFESDFVPEETPLGYSRQSTSSSSNNLFDAEATINAPISQGSDNVSQSRSLNTTSYSDRPINPFSATETDGGISVSSQNTQHTRPFIAPKPELAKPLLPHEGVARAIALFDFRAVQAGDLPFSRGEVITITQKSNSTDDWWRGKLNGQEGIFPANYVEVV